MTHVTYATWRETMVFFILFFVIIIIIIIIINIIIIFIYLRFLGFGNAKYCYHSKFHFFNLFLKLKTAKGLNVVLTQTCHGDQKALY